MNESTFKIIAILIVILGLFLLLYFLRKIEKKNNVLTVNEASLDWKDVKCIKCEQIMEKGYAFAGKGINWVPKKGVSHCIVDTILQNAMTDTFSSITKIEIKTNCP